ncbi:hypothetical protein KKG31_00055 [Patescibacteria group bacterium]|nr:hypothetical protein [Patescibacteria group bacterium]MBU1757583.1 hypothetical protein [Patescibacteria group bacterium]MBU1959587.1 hypothetical protein [bacterium]
MKYKAKERRNQDYFGHLSELNDDYLAVKMADRIHNLRTMDNFSSKKIYYKLRETEKYFFHVAKERMPEAYFIMKNEVARLKKIA